MPLRQQLNNATEAGARPRLQSSMPLKAAHSNTLKTREQRIKPFRSPSPLPS
jgi:hypothetical protein